MVMPRHFQPIFRILSYALFAIPVGFLMQPALHQARATGAATLTGARVGGPVSDETYRWRPVAIGAGGFITGYSTDRTGATRIVRTDVYGAYIWLPDARRWAQLVTTASMPRDLRAQDAANEGVFEIVVAPSDPRRLYMAFKGAVFRSDDRGRTFLKTAGLGDAPLSFDPNSEFRNYGPYMAVSPSDPNLILFGTPENGLWRSENAGASWSKVASVPDSADQRPAPGIQSAGTIIWFERHAGAARARIWAMSPGHGVYASSDGGRSFSRLVGPDQTQPLMLSQGDFAPDGTFFGVDPDSQSVWRYRNGAWVNLTKRSGLSERRFAAVAVNPSTSQVFVFDEGGRTYRSSNGGDSWWPLLHRTRVGDGDPPYLRVNDQSYFALGRVQFDPVVSNRLWVGAGTGVYYTDISDNMLRLTWTSETRGIEELVANDVIKPPGHAPLFAAWDFGIHVKEDLNAFSTTYGPKERLLVSAQQLAWSPSNPSFVVTNASDARMCCAEDGDAVLAGFSLDAGRSWTKFASLPHPPGTRVDDPWRMSFGTIAVSANDINNIIWAPTFHRAPFFTKDRGVTWTRVVLPGERLPFTGSHSALHYHRRTLAADRVEPSVFYLYHSGDGANPGLAGLWVTHDGGGHWTKVFSGEIAPSSQYSAKLRPVPGHAGHLFFTSTVYGPSDTRLRRSIDGGSTWRIVNGVDQTDDIAFGKAAAGASYPTIFISARVGGVYGIWRSTDDTATWQRLGQFPLGSLDQVTVVEGDPDIFGRVYLGHKGSGWVYGEPATCKPAAYQFPAEVECSGVRSTSLVAQQNP